MRQVLNFAVSDFVQDDMIRAAQLAVDQGYEGTLSRHACLAVTPPLARTSAGPGTGFLSVQCPSFRLTPAGSEPLKTRFEEFIVRVIQGMTLLLQVYDSVVPFSLSLTRFDDNARASQCCPCP